MGMIKEIVIDGNEIFDFISYSNKWKDNVDLEFRNCDFTKEDMIQLSNKEYERLAFVDCNFEDDVEMNNINTKSLTLTHSKIKSYGFVYNMIFLEHLTILGGKIDMPRLMNLKNLEYLRLSHSHIENIEKYTSTKLNYLFLDNTNIVDLSFIKRIPNLKLLSISENQLQANKELLQELSGHIKIILDSIVEMEACTNDEIWL